MSTNRLWVVGALMLAVVFGATDAFGRGWGRGRGRGKGPGMGSCGPAALATLGLTAEQQQQVNKLRAAKDKRLATVRGELEVKRVELRQLWSVKEPSRKAILDKQAEMDVLRKQIREARVDFRLSVLGLLTEEQKARFVTLACPGPGCMRSGQGWGANKQCGCCGHGGRGGRFW